MKINSLLESDLMFERAWDITQFYRGELFTIVDCVLGMMSIKQEQQREGLQLFSAVLALLAAWLNKFPGMVQHYKRGVDDPELYLIDRDVALVSCWPEIFMTLGRLFRLDTRCEKFFKTAYEPTPPGFDVRST